MLLFKKRKKIKVLKEIIFLWYSACMEFVEKEKLSEPRPMVGTCCFFIGSIDAICQHTNISDKDFAKLSISLMEEMNFPLTVVHSVLKNFYGKNERVVFAFNATRIGIDSILKWYNASFMNVDATKVLSMQITEWYKNPDITLEELTLFGIKN